MEKNFTRNENAVSPVLGAVLILAIGVSILTTVQLNFVPVWNAQEELDHLKKMLDDFKELKSGIESSIQSGTTLSLPLSMGFKYSPKMFVYNPRESAYASLDIQENTWAEVRYNEMFPEGMTDDTSIKNISTSTITYTLKGAQNYNAFIYEHGMIRRNGSNYTASSQTALANGTVYLLSVKPLGSETTAGMEKRTVNIYPTSQQKNSILGKNVWLILHTKPEPKYVNWWKSSLIKEGGDVRLASDSSGTIISYINSSVIKMGEAYISTASMAAPAHAIPYRVVKVTPDNTNLPVDGITNLIAEVQDYYNNPVPNVLVSFSINDSRKPGNANATATLLQNSAVSGADGRASVMLRTSGAGFYYIDATASGNTTTFAYPASSQGGVISLSYTGTGPLYTVTATLKNSMGDVQNNKQMTFDTSDGTLSDLTQTTDLNGNASTTLDDTSAAGLRLTNIQSTNINDTSAIITWDTINNITITTNSGYIFNSIDIPTNVNSTGCVSYGKVARSYPYSACDSIRSSHNISLTNLLPGTAYYFVVNSSRPGNGTINSTEYMFVTEAGEPDTMSPAGITGLTNTTYEPLYITWTWNDPTDADFDHVEVYIDGAFKVNVTGGVQSFNATYLRPNSTHTIATRTVDISGNVNTTWVNHTASTPTAYAYVFDFLGTTGSIANPDNARNASDSDAFAALAEEMVGGINMSNRSINPDKVIAMGTQSGVYTPSSLDSNDGSSDVTMPESRRIKTVVYYMGQRENAADLAANTNFTTSPMNVYLPEQGITVREAWLELRQLSGTTAAASVTTLNLYFNGVDYSVINGGTYQANTGESLITVARANVTSAFSSFTNPTSFIAGVRTAGAASNAQSLLLYITYEYDSISPTQLKTVRYPLNTTPASRASGSSSAFNYNVRIPEAATIRSSWFEIRGKVDSANTNDATIRAKIEPNATFSTGISLDMSLRDNYEFMYLFKTTPEFSLNTPQILTVQNLNQMVYTLGGEVVVTYEYSNAEPVQLKTVKYYVGQRTAVGGITTITNSTIVFIPEQSVNIRSIWARVRATYTTGTAGTHTVAGNIGGTASASQVYTVDTNNALIGDYTIIYNMTGAASALANNTVVFVNNTFSQTAHGPPATELYITYEYDPASLSELNTVEYLAGQSAVQASSRNEYFEVMIPEYGTSRRSAYIDYMTMSAAAADYSTTSAIDTTFSSQTVNIDGNLEALTAGVLNGDAGGRIASSGNTYAINYSVSPSTASFSGIARLTYEFVKNISLDVTYTFTETNLSSTWQSIILQDNSYGDTLTNASIFNSASGQWEPILANAFTGGVTPAEHVNVVKGAAGNASEYDSGSGRIKIRYNWTGALASNDLGVDMINVTVRYLSGGLYRLNVTTNTTNIPDSPTQHELQIRYNVSNDEFTLQVWDGSTWNDRATLNGIVMSNLNITLLPNELRPDGTFTGNAGNINRYYVLVRYLDLNANGVQGKLYLDYQRVYSS